MSNNNLKVIYWNIGQARREEQCPETCWDVRKKPVADLLLKTNADIIVLVELRDLGNNNWRKFFM